MAIYADDSIHQGFWDLTIGYEQGRAKKESHYRGNSYDLWLINSEACVIREVEDSTGKETFYAIERGASCFGGRDFWRSTKGSFKRAKKAFEEKYSPAWLRAAALARN